MAVKWKRAKPAKPGGPEEATYASLVGLEASDPMTAITIVREGLSYQSLETFQISTLFSTRDTAELVSIPPRTMIRRKAEGRLDPQESDRLVRVARVFAKALGVFGGDTRATHDWFQTPARALRGERPIHLARTDLGSREVEVLLDRLEHGVLT